MKICGLLGEKLSHSYSPQIHKLLGNYRYSLFEKSPDEVSDFLKKGILKDLMLQYPIKKQLFHFALRFPILQKNSEMSTQ